MSDAKPVELIGLYLDKNGTTMSGGIRDRDLDALQALIDQLRPLPQNARGRVAVWGNKSGNERAPSHRVLYLPPRDARPAPPKSSDDIDF